MFHVKHEWIIVARLFAIAWHLAVSVAVSRQSLFEGEFHETISTRSLARMGWDALLSTSSACIAFGPMAIRSFDGRSRVDYANEHWAVGGASHDLFVTRGPWISPGKYEEQW